MNDEKNLWIKAILPIVLLLGLLYLFLNFGPLGVFKANVPPIEEVFIQKVILEPETIILKVINDGPEPVTISQVMVNKAYWKFSMEDNTLNPLDKGTVVIHYPWLEGDAEFISLLSSNGVEFTTEVPVATMTPKFNATFFKSFVLLGLYVGVIPVFLGLLWLPLLKRLKGKWYGFLLSLTIGLLVFLGFDALSEAIDLFPMLPQSYNGTGIVLIGFMLAVLSLSAVTYFTESKKVQDQSMQSLIWGYMIALGIGIHNLGEGLAIGSAYAIGEIALGATLVIGFMVHNVTEGIAIVAPLTKIFDKSRKFYTHLIFMGLLAGAPTIIGALIGGFSYSAAFGVLFLAIGAGAIFDVAYDILKHMAQGNWTSLFSVPNVLGFLAGMLIMYLTGFLVVG